MNQSEHILHMIVSGSVISQTYRIEKAVTVVLKRLVLRHN